MTDKTRVINIRSGQPYDVYVGRGGDPRTGNSTAVPFNIVFPEGW